MQLHVTVSATNKNGLTIAMNVAQRATEIIFLFKMLSWIRPISDKELWQTINDDGL